MPRTKSLSEFAVAAAAPQPPEPKAGPVCDSCGGPFKTAGDGYCFDCRIPDWTDEQCVAHKRFGPGIIGRAAFELAQSVSEKTGDGKFGPALLGVLVDQNRDLRPPKDAA